METFLIAGFAVFLITAAVTYHVFAEKMNYSTVPSVTLAIAVGLLSVLGLKERAKSGDIGVIFLPYAFFGIVLVLAIVVALITNFALKKHKEHLYRCACKEYEDEFAEQENDKNLEKPKDKASSYQIRG